VTFIRVLCTLRTQMLTSNVHRCTLQPTTTPTNLTINMHLYTRQPSPLAVAVDFVRRTTLIHANLTIKIQIDTLCTLQPSPLAVAVDFVVAFPASTNDAPFFQFTGERGYYSVSGECPCDVHLCSLHYTHANFISRLICNSACAVQVWFRLG
jgi:hypothetical protein